MSSIFERLGKFITSFHERYEEYKRPRVPVNLLKSKEPDTVKREASLPEVNTPKPVVNIEENMIGEYFRP